MNKLLSLLFMSSVLMLASCSSVRQEAASPGKPAIKNLSVKKFSQTTRANYLLFLPENYDASSTNRWPLILFLHGAGERCTNIWKTVTHGPTSYIKNHADFPFIVVFRNVHAGQKWSDEILLGILDRVSAKYAVDTNRIYLTGLSMGGFGAWSLATTYPERFAAVAPICGGDGVIGVVLSKLDEQKISDLKKLPFWVFHGAKDNVVPLAESQRMVDMLKEAGVKEVKFTVYPEAMHNSWTETYNNPELYQWFLAHERESSK